MTFLLSVLRTNRKMMDALRPQAPLPQLCWPALEVRTENSPELRGPGGQPGVWRETGQRVATGSRQNSNEFPSSPQPPPPTPSLSTSQLQTTHIHSVSLGDPSTAPHSPFLRP